MFSVKYEKLYIPTYIYTLEIMCYSILKMGYAIIIYKKVVKRVCCTIYNSRTAVPISMIFSFLDSSQAPLITEWTLKDSKSHENISGKNTINLTRVDIHITLRLYQEVLDSRE